MLFFHSTRSKPITSSLYVFFSHVGKRWEAKKHYHFEKLACAFLHVFFGAVRAQHAHNLQSREWLRLLAPLLVKASLDGYFRRKRDSVVDASVQLGFLFLHGKRRESWGGKVQRRSTFKGLRPLLIFGHIIYFVDIASFGAALDLKSGSVGFRRWGDFWLYL